jgi:two-component system, LuxR family, response regulator FixJ
VAIGATLAKVLGLPKAPLVAIVDDDEAVREALSDLLQVLDLSCRTYDRAEAFMAEYVPGRFDCLITDVSMPGRSGLELLERLRSLGSAMPVIVVTADAREATRSRAMRGGAAAFLTKPISSEELARHLQSVLKQPRSSHSGNGQEPPSDG